MKNVTPTSKTLILVSTLLAFVFSFSACKRDKYRFYVIIYNGGYQSTVKCDSFQIQSKVDCVIWVDGTKMKIIGDMVRPASNY
jgi:hypothetical protein